MAELVIKGGTLVDSVGERAVDVVVRDGVVVGTGHDLSAATVIDAGGCVVSPGLVDIHTHLREPGREEAETIESGTRGAVLGGFTAVVAMPNTSPVIDGAAGVRDVLELGRRALCDVAVAGAITVGRLGTQLAPMAEMAELGVKLFTDDGTGVQDDRLMRRALEYASGLDVTLAQHCENTALSAGGHMNEGALSGRLGIPGVPAEAEELMIMRDVTLSRLTGGRVHFQQVSTAGSVGIVGAAKAGGLHISAEVAPHHFSLTEQEVATYDAVFKVNPPLRTDADVVALKAGLADGVVDAIATGHAPHEPHIKELPFDEAPCGVLGLETALALAITELDLPIARILALLSWQPAAVAGLSSTHGGPIEAGCPANLVVIDPTATWVVDTKTMASLSANCPYDGRKLTGRVRHTIVHGEALVIDGEAQR
ncbi:MAG: dihydroorotase [Acidimicrobiales bacterium]